MGFIPHGYLIRAKTFSFGIESHNASPYFNLYDLEMPSSTIFQQLKQSFIFEWPSMDGNPLVATCNGMVCRCQDSTWLSVNVLNSISFHISLFLKDETFSSGYKSYNADVIISYLNWYGLWMPKSYLSLGE